MMGVVFLLHRMGLPRMIRRVPYIHTNAALRSNQHDLHIKECYFTLNVSEDCSNDEVREAYLVLAKKFHPDSGSKTANQKAFSHVSQAYSTLVRHRQGMDEVKEVDQSEEAPAIRHTPPQHRQYLSYEGIGYGTPSIREKQYRNFKVARAEENVYQYKTTKYAAEYETSLSVRTKQQAKEQLIRGGIDRMVEDLIQQSMERGDFSNLAGSGKPLPYAPDNPHIDSMTHNLNKILIQNGYVPEWVDTERNIRDGLGKASQHLRAGRDRAGPEPLSPPAKRIWDEAVRKFHDDISAVNVNINRLNLVAPSLRQQMVPYNETSILAEVRRVVEEYRMKDDGGSKTNVPVYNGPGPEGQVGLRDVWRELKALFAKQ